MAGFRLLVVTLDSFQVGNLIERACKLLTLRQESYIKVVTGLTELASFQAASAAGAFEPEPERRLMEQHRFVKSLPIPHALLEHRSGGSYLLVVRLQHLLPPRKR